MSGQDSDEEVVIPLASETLDVSRRMVETARVRVATVTREHDETVDLALAQEDVEIERVPLGCFVDEVPPMREEGDTIVIPVVEEVVVTRLFLREEVHVRRVRTERQHRETVTLRSQDVSVVRVATDGACSPGDEALLAPHMTTREER